MLAYNRDAQVWGWFAITDGRHWPVAMQDAKSDSIKPKDDIAAPYKSREKGAPADLNLESLKLTFENNLYFAAPGQGFFNWGTAWQKHEKFASVEEIKKAIGLENAGASQAADPRFADYLSHDLRVPAESPAIKMGCYPKGDVPGVRLGILNEDAKK